LGENEIAALVVGDRCEKRRLTHEGKHWQSLLEVLGEVTIVTRDPQSLSLLCREWSSESARLCKLTRNVFAVRRAATIATDQRLTAKIKAVDQELCCALYLVA
jgi:hypothetical protein